MLFLQWPLQLFRSSRHGLLSINNIADSKEAAAEETDSEILKLIEQPSQRDGHAWPHDQSNTFIKVFTTNYKAWEQCQTLPTPLS